MNLNTFYILGIILVMSFSSKDKNDYKSNGEITGADNGMCICCGGWDIQINKVTYQFDSLPPNTNIDLRKETFPILVKLDWQLNKIGCKNRISILRISRK
jgi:hypothetical protein